MDKIKAPISIGELIDKISILQIKSAHTDSPYVKKELEDLLEIAKVHNVLMKEDLDQLLDINSKLWNIEDELRLFERKHIFDDEFISLARLVYTYNDKRSLIKKNINEKFNSDYREIKVHK